MRRTLPILAALALTACVQRMPVAYNPNPPPPPVRAEVIPKPPVSDALQIWRPGHWDWTGAGYVWTQGEWQGREGHGTTWQDGYWSNVSGDWSWIPARWL